MTGRVVSGSHGIAVTADILPDEATLAPEMLILPGGMPGTTNLDAHPVTDLLLERTLSSGGRVAAICAAPSILGKRGLLRGREAVCYPGFEEHLLGAQVAIKPVVTSDVFTTAVGMGAAYAFGLELLTLLKGKETAAQVAASAHIPC